MTTKIKLPVTLMRGGTSKGAYLLRKDMPPERKDWDSVLLKLMGSPDRKQIDGLGGSQSVTSKVAIIENPVALMPMWITPLPKYLWISPSSVMEETAVIYHPVSVPLRLKKVSSQLSEKKQPSGSLIRIPGKSLLKRSIQQMARCVMTETILLLACPVRPLPSSLDSLIPAVPLVKASCQREMGWMNLRSPILAACPFPLSTQQIPWFL